MLRTIIVLLATASVAFPAATSASPDWTGSFVPPAQEDGSGPSGHPATHTSGTAEPPPVSDDEFPWMWLAIGSSAVALGLAGVEITRMRRSAPGWPTSSAASGPRDRIR